jgi:polyisoprenoid-binding protein YceI
VFEVDHLGFSTQRGRFNKTSGRITLDTAARQGSVDVTIDAASIDMGFAKWNDNMRGENYFNTDVHRPSPSRPTGWCSTASARSPPKAA